MSTYHSIAMIAAAALLAATPLLMAQNAGDTAPSEKPATQPATTQAAVITRPNGLKITEVSVPTGDTGAKAGDLVVVQYTGKLADGTVFDSSRTHGKPFSFRLGEGQVIKGWDEGLVGMQIGQKRVLVIPPDLAYGKDGSGPIPANATLTFEVELLGIVRGL